MCHITQGGLLQGWEAGRFCGSQTTKLKGCIQGFVYFLPLTTPFIPEFFLFFPLMQYPTNPAPRAGEENASFSHQNPVNFQGSLIFTEALPPSCLRFELNWSNLSAISKGNGKPHITLF